MTPLRKWQIGEQERILEYPAEPAQLDVIMAHVAERRVFHYGVEINSLHYNAPDLQVLRRRHGENLHVRVKYDEEDVGYVNVYDEDQKVYIRVGAIDQDYAAGLRLIQHETIRAKLRDEGQDPDSRLNLLRKKEELRDLVETALASKKMAQRKRAHVHLGTNSTLPRKAEKQADPPPQSPLGLPSLPQLDGTPPKFTVRHRRAK